MTVILSFPSSSGSSNGISPLLLNAGLVSHYRRYLNPVDPRMFLTNGNVTELNKSSCKGKNIASCFKVLSGVAAINCRCLPHPRFLSLSLSCYLFTFEPNDPYKITKSHKNHCLSIKNKYNFTKALDKHQRIVRG